MDSSAVQADATRSHPPGDRLTWRTVWLLTVACASVATVIAAMAALNTALAEIAPDIGATSSELTWLLDGYTLVLAALLLPAGAIGDRYGRRGILIAGLIVFAVGSILPIWLSDPTTFIATRCLAGAGAAFVMPATLSLISSGVPASKQTLGVSIWAAVAGVGAIAGFFITGLLLEFFSWRSLFITFAISATLLAVMACSISTSKDRNPPPFDVLGSITSVAAIGLFVFGLIEAPHAGWFDPIVLGALVGGIALAGVFVMLQLRRDRRLIDVRLFTNRAFGAGSFGILLQFLASFGMFYVFLQHLQLVMGYSALGAAIALVPLVIVVMVSALVGNAVLARVDLRILLAGGIFILGVGLLILGALNPSEYWQMAIVLAAVGFGIGIATAPSTTAIMLNTPPDNQGVGSAVNDTARELGAAIGIALSGSIAAAGYNARIGPTSESARDSLTQMAGELARSGNTAQSQMIAAQADTVGEHIGRSLAEAMAVSGQITERIPGPLGPRIADGAATAFEGPMNTVYFVLGSIVVVGSVILAFWSPKHPGGVPSKQSAADQDDADAASLAQR